MNKSHSLIKRICSQLAKFLIEKNKRYGNSALEPIMVFNKKSSTDTIYVRLDDKLSRIKNNEELRKNDIVDLLGYLILLCISKNWISFEELID